MAMEITMETIFFFLCFDLINLFKWAHISLIYRGAIHKDSLCFKFSIWSLFFWEIEIYFFAITTEPHGKTIFGAFSAYAHAPASAPYFYVVKKLCPKKIGERLVRAWMEIRSIRVV